MLVFGHIGLTLGATWGLHHVLEKKGDDAPTAQEQGLPGEKYGRVSFARKTLSFFRRLDYRIIIVSSLLPDIIDKPVGAYFFRDTFSSGHIFGHTLLFFLVILFTGIFLYKIKSSTGLLAAAMGTFAHIMFDRIWQSPRTLFWPFFGTSFAKEDVSIIVPPILQEPPPVPAPIPAPGPEPVPVPEVVVPPLDATDINNWIPDVFRHWLDLPRDYVPEIAGIAVLLFFTIVLIRKKQLRRFLKSGQAPIIGQ